MTRKDIQRDATPDWFLKAFQLMQDAERHVRNIDIELRDAMELAGIDSRLISEMQNVRNALGVVKVSLSVMEMTADKVIRELTGSESTDLQQAFAT